MEAKSNHKILIPLTLLSSIVIVVCSVCSAVIFVADADHTRNSVGGLFWWIIIAAAIVEHMMTMINTKELKWQYVYTAIQVAVNMAAFLYYACRALPILDWMGAAISVAIAFGGVILAGTPVVVRTMLSANRSRSREKKASLIPSIVMLGITVISLYISCSTGLGTILHFVVIAAETAALAVNLIFLIRNLIKTDSLKRYALCCALQIGLFSSIYYCYAAVIWVWFCTNPPFDKMASVFFYFAPLHWLIPVAVLLAAAVAVGIKAIVSKKQHT